jgi:hypothetical protein
MNREELQAAISHTISEIEEVKKEIAKATSLLEKRRLTRKKLQYLQLWHLDQLKGMD